jgi:hypothetical protein
VAVRAGCAPATDTIRDGLVVLDWELPSNRASARLRCAVWLATIFLLSRNLSGLFDEMAVEWRQLFEAKQAQQVERFKIWNCSA